MDETALQDQVGRLTYAKMGRIVDLLEKEREDHRLTIGILDAVKKGKLPMNRLEVTKNGWKILPPPKGTP